MKKSTFLQIICLSVIVSSLFLSCRTNVDHANGQESQSDTLESNSTAVAEQQKVDPPAPQVDSTAFRNDMLALVNGDTTGKWPAKGQPIPLPGAILPQKRIIAYYGNLYSKRMGILGEYAPKEMLARLDEEIAKWNEVDSVREAIPALHYIAVVAQGSAGNDEKYRNRMPDSQIDSVLAIAEMRDALVFLDIQVALSTIQDELPHLEKYLKLPHVHLGIDPEFSMKDGSQPGRRIGHFTAADINYASEYLARIVQEYDLPPKVFIVHRFTQGMVRNYQDIQLRPEVQTVIHMDGWGPPALKKDTYKRYVYNEPVEFTGFKIFYKNDIKQAPNRLLTPEELMELKPIPVYIQYQ